MLAREAANLCWIGSCKPRGYDGQTQPCPVDGVIARQPGLPERSYSAEFQAKTQGAASQAIKALKAGGYLARQRSKADGPSVLSSPPRSAERTFN